MLNYLTARRSNSMMCMQIWLQEFAWSEKGRRAKLKAREQMADHVPHLLTEPIFCFETAVRMLYWCVCMHGCAAYPACASAQLLE